MEAALLTVGRLCVYSGSGAPVKGFLMMSQVMARKHCPAMNLGL